MAVYCIDIDNTLCHSVEDDYAHSVPCPEAIKKVNDLFNQGHRITLFTGRGSFDNTDWRPLTENQLRQWGVRYHQLILGKPHADVFIDDKAINTADWLSKPSDKLIEVERDWGRELWLINCEEYCAKLLYLPKGAYAGEHYHKIKKETFWCLQGVVIVTLGETGKAEASNYKEYILDPFSRPVTVMPSQPHTFHGTTNSIILEISTHHSDEDSVMLSKGWRPEV